MASCWTVRASNASGVSSTGSGKDRPTGGCHLGRQLLARHRGLGVLLQVELVALPGNAAKHRSTSGLQAFVGIADDHLHTSQPALEEAREELPPMGFLLAQ